MNETDVLLGDNILIEELATIISDELLEIGEDGIYSKLIEWDMIKDDISAEPHQVYIDKGYFIVEEKTINTSYGVKLTKTCRCTPKGQIAIVERFRKELNNK